MNPMNLVSMLQQFRQNPMQMLMQRRMNVPQNITNDPQAILNHLLQTGQISQQQVNSAYQMARSFNGISPPGAHGGRYN